MAVVFQTCHSTGAVIGPDAAGYTASDAVPFAFENISSTGTRVLANEDLGIVNANLGFAFKFYGANYTSVYFSLKGLLTFGAGNSSFDNLNLSNTNLTPNVPTIAALWSDWITTNATADAVYYQTSGSPGNHRFIVQWNNIFGWRASPSGVTFEAILYEASGDILFQYLDVLTGDARTNGATSTVGIRDTSGQSNGRNLQWSINQPVIQNGQAISFSYRPRILTQPQSKTVTCANNATFTVLATGLGTLSYQWRLNGQPLGGASSSSLTVSNVSCVNTGAYSVVITNTAGMEISSNATLLVNAPGPLGITCPDDLAVSSMNDVPPPDTNAVIVAGACGHAVVTHLGDSVVATGCTNTILRSYQAVDSCGRLASCVQRIDVSIPPKILGFSTSQSVQPDGVQVAYCASVQGVDLNFDWNVIDGDPVSPPFQSGNCFYVTYSPTDTNLNTVNLILTNPCGGTGDNSPPATTCGICLSRGFPSLVAGTNGSGIGPTLAATNCGLSASAKWFKMIATNDTGLVTISTEGSVSSDTALSVYIGPLTSPATLTNVACSRDISSSNKQSRATFTAEKGQVYWVVVDPGTNAAGLRLATGFEPRIATFGMKADGSFELQSSLAPPIPYRVLAATSLTNNATNWATVLSTNSNVGYQIYFRDTNALNLGRRFYRLSAAP